MIVLGPLILLAVGALAVSGISTRHGAHSPARCGLLSYRLPGAGCRLFFLGLVLAAAAMSGLARIVTGLGRGVRRFPAARQLPHVPPPGPLPAGAAATRRFGGTNRTPWSRTPSWPHRDENRTGRGNTERGH
jgi:hypothetical protein